MPNSLVYILSLCWTLFVFTRCCVFRSATSYHPPMLFNTRSSRIQFRSALCDAHFKTDKEPSLLLMQEEHSVILKDPFGLWLVYECKVGFAHSMFLASSTPKWSSFSSTSNVCSYIPFSDTSRFVHYYPSLLLSFESVEVSYSQWSPPSGQQLERRWQRETMYKFWKCVFMLRNVCWTEPHERRLFVSFLFLLKRKSRSKEGSSGNISRQTKPRVSFGQKVVLAIHWNIHVEMPSVLSRFFQRIKEGKGEEDKVQSNFVILLHNL